MHRGQGELAAHCPLRKQNNSFAQFRIIGVYLIEWEVYLFQVQALVEVKLHIDARWVGNRDRHEIESIEKALRYSPRYLVDTINALDIVAAVNIVYIEHEHIPATISS